MPLINYQAQWADAVELGIAQAIGDLAHAATVADRYAGGALELRPKRTTIRRPGRAKPGDTLYHYTGLRTKAARKLGETLCIAVVPLTVIAEGWWKGATVGAPMMTLGAQILTDAQVEALARMDTAGLWGWPELAAFFADSYGLPFEGELICW